MLLFALRGGKAAAARLCARYPDAGLKPATPACISSGNTPVRDRIFTDTLDR